MMAGNKTPGAGSIRESDQEYFLRVPAGFTREYTDNHSDVSLQMFRYEQELKEFHWRGGEHFFDGKHDDFCYVCGGTMELFGCQTCETCYHSTCMTPSLEVNEVPTFWFCPHCVDREWHVPPVPSPSTYFTPPPLVSDSTEASNISESPRSQVTQQNSSTVTDFAMRTDAASPNTARRKETPKAETTGKSTAANINNAKVRFKPLDPPPNQGKHNRAKRSYSPPRPRKKSKYSAFSSEVDKALSIIHSELEKAAQGGRSEGSLQDTINNLEQRLRIQDGQLQLTNRELELSQKALATEHCQAERLQSENILYKEEVIKLREAVEKKDAELRDWRAKLRSMIGTDLG